MAKSYQCSRFQGGTGNLPVPVGYQPTGRAGSSLTGYCVPLPCQTRPPVAAEHGQVGRSTHFDRIAYRRVIPIGMPPGPDASSVGNQKRLVFWTLSNSFLPTLTIWLSAMIRCPRWPCRAASERTWTVGPAKPVQRIGGRGDSNLAQIADAGSASAGLARATERGQEHAGQDGDDGDHDQ